MHIQSNNERSAFYDVTWSFIKFLLNIVCLQISSLPKFIGQIPPKWLGCFSNLTQEIFSNLFFFFLHNIFALHSKKLNLSKIWKYFLNKMDVCISNSVVDIFHFCRLKIIIFLFSFFNSKIKNSVYIGGRSGLECQVFS